VWQACLAQADDSWHPQAIVAFGAASTGCGGGRRNGILALDDIIRIIGRNDGGYDTVVFEVAFFTDLQSRELPDAFRRLNAAHGQGRVDEVDALLRFEPG
jgi:hypothetical protein